MKRLTFLFLFAAASMFAAEEHKSEAHEPSIIWKWANFALLAGGLGYLASKHGAPYFKSRTEEIQSGLRDARKLRQESEARVLEIEKRVQNLQSEMDGLRDSSKAEMQAESTRIRQETERALAKIQAASESEIAASAKAARYQLKEYAAALAIDLAKVQIRERMTPAASSALAQNFVHQLSTAKKAAH
ncbi:MAG: ATP synthase F0 subunit B [Candidatus Solibacter usitatus]|nr:ATP synthase F0 subunit B [Candidatus Solibacter usitatus]